jgi:penicillin-binding protein 2
MVPRFKLRLCFLTLILLAGFAALLARLWAIQVKRHHEFARLVPGTSTVSQRVAGVRGEIKDRNGITLATNRATFEVSLNLADIEKEYRRRHTAVPMFEWDSFPGGVRKIKSEPDIVQMVREEVIEPLRQMGLARGFSASALRVHYRSKKDVVPFSYRKDLRFEEFATFAEYNLGLPGVTVSVRPVREYPFGSLACHILGYVREAEDTIPENEKGKYQFYMGDDFGISGIEKSKDVELRGKPGVRQLRKNEKGVFVGELLSRYEEPKPGADVYLTIDARKQYLVERILREAGVGRCGAVVLDPNNGEILAMASVPSFNPNHFIPSIPYTEWQEYLGNRTKPFLNRAITSSPPGSTFKIPVALAGLMAGLDKKTYYCDGGQSYGGEPRRCWISKKGGQHGRLTLSESIKVSCNDFYYNYGNDAGIKRIVALGQLLGLGSPTGIPVDREGGGRLPTPEWMKMYRNTRWTSALTAISSIGQGDVEATPLQMAIVAGTVAMGGKCYGTKLVLRVVDSSTSGELEGRFPPLPLPKLKADLVKEGISPEQIEKVRLGMKLVINDGGGTARRAYSSKQVNAGKTGSATVAKIIVNGEEREDTHAWFIAFAPYDDPKVAVCVRVEGGSAGGKVAAPIAAAIIERVFAVDEGYRVNLRPVPEAEGHFDFLEEVTLGGDGGDFMDDDMDEPVILEAPAVEGSRGGEDTATPPAPPIQPEADEQGKVEQAAGAERNTEYKKSPRGRNP